MPALRRAPAPQLNAVFDRPDEEGRVVAGM